MGCCASSEYEEVVDVTPGIPVNLGQPMSVGRGLGKSAPMINIIDGYVDSDHIRCAQPPPAPYVIALSGIFGRFSETNLTSDDVTRLQGGVFTKYILKTVLKDDRQNYYEYTAIVVTGCLQPAPEPRYYDNFCKFLGLTRYHSRRSGVVVYLLKSNEGYYVDLREDSAICRNLNMELGPRR